MFVDVIASVNEARSDDFIHKTVIVVDVLRATSTIVTALAHGCSAVVPVETVHQAKQLQEPGDLLGGERYCKKIAGFDYGNSPFEYTGSECSGRRVILTTTNGTRAIQKSQKASRVLAGSMLNAEACAKTAFALNRDIAILCAGTQDDFCLEDGLCAGLLLHHLERLGDRTGMNDLGLAMKLAFESASGQIEQILLGCASGKKLIKLGQKDDVLYCAQMNRFDLVPVFQDQKMIVF
ncbi:MAG: 2-phosphosulfolactate phosphatase [Paenibacillus sp.]|uniref:2-phosphosulfolactate phosphatase n=1 Tax=Paenibacillus sp. GCM10012303 TaxID=3317340 RepID=UPI0029ED262D|nr:2-phosphosulfolactate phosphatase [Paenibacillus sp.]